MSKRMPVDQAARDRALDVTTSFIVQAPAGSGKTELLIQRCLALLATLEAPESLLAITFTRKAAAEMRGRILDALREAQAPSGAAGHADTRTGELARAALAADTRYGWRLLANPSRLRIQTIDALNLGLARRLPVLSGLRLRPRRGGTRRRPVSPRGDPAALASVGRRAGACASDRTRDRTSRQPRAGLSRPARRDTPRPRGMAARAAGRRRHYRTGSAVARAARSGTNGARAGVSRVAATRVSGGLAARRGCRCVRSRRGTCGCRARLRQLRNGRMLRHRRTTGSRACLCGVASPNSSSPRRAPGGSSSIAGRELRPARAGRCSDGGHVR